MDDERNKRSFVCDLVDVPVVAHALAVENGTYVGHHDGQCRRVKELHDLVTAQVPPCAQLFDPKDWRELCRLISTGASFEVVHDRMPWGRAFGCGQALVRIDGKTWRSRNADLMPDAPDLDALRAFLAEYAPGKRGPTARL